MELDQVKRKIEGKAKLTLKMDEARGTYVKKDMETFESISLFLLIRPLSHSTDALPVVLHFPKSRLNWPVIRKEK